MALSGRKVQHMQARVCQQERTPGESISSSVRPAVCLINWMNTFSGEGGREREREKTGEGREGGGESKKDLNDDCFSPLLMYLRLQILDIKALLNNRLHLFNGISQVFLRQESIEDLHCLLVPCAIQLFLILCIRKITL